jgi:putative transposase
MSFSYQEKGKGVRPLFLLTSWRWFVDLDAMGRPRRTSVGGYFYHVLNRGNGRQPVFCKDFDYEAFLHVLAQTQEHVPAIRLLAYCLMPNHWHMGLWPLKDGELSDFMHWHTLTHTQRWHSHYQSIGGCHLYQGRFKSFPVQSDEHYLTVCRYVEGNALQAGLVPRAESWRWGSLAPRLGVALATGPVLSDGPLPWPKNWLDQVNRSLTEKELDSLRQCVERGQHNGGEAWVKRAAGKLGLASTLRPRGRPEKAEKKGS